MITLKSNKHNAQVKCLLSPPKTTHNPMIFKDAPPRPSWKNTSELKRSFFKNLDVAMIGNVTKELETLTLNLNNVNQSIINKHVSEIELILKTASNASGCLPRQKRDLRSRKPPQQSKRQQNHKPWYSQNCEIRRRAYLVSKRLFHTSKSTEALTKMKRNCKMYKLQLRSDYREFYQEFYNDLREMKSIKPQDYWRKLAMLEGSTHKNVSISDKKWPIFVNHFTNLSSGSELPEKRNLRGDLHNENNEINKPIESNEVIKAVNSLSNNKACGMDQLINEYFKASSEKLLPVLTLLFNIILKTGYIPDSWTVGIIKPIHKKGDTDNPANFRPITILSCFAKLFTSVLNNRLVSFVESSMIIGPEQAGFRHNFSTTDHIYTLKSICHKSISV